MILLQKLIIVVMKFPHGEKTINLLGRTKLKIFNMHLRKFNQIKIDHKRRFLRFPGSYKRLINEWEEYWHQKSRNMWHSSGDLNTKFYHALTKQRRVCNKIVGLHDEMGNWIA